MIYPARLTFLWRLPVRTSRLRCQLVPKCSMSSANTTRYKAVIFDMGGVLLPSPYQKAIEWEQQHGIPRGTIAQVNRTGGEGNTFKKFMRGEMGAREFVEAFGKECSDVAGFPVQGGSLLSALTSGPMAQPIPAMVEAVQSVRAEGLKTAVLSNNFFLWDGGTYLPLERSLFDVIIESCLEGMCKPDPRIYQLCLERLGVSAEEAVFLDDSGFNTKAAAQLGIRAIQVSDPLAALIELEGVLGFPLSVFITQPAMQLPVEQLTQYMQRVLNLPTLEPVTVRQFRHSQSSSTYLLKFGDRYFVLRKEPPQSHLPSVCAVEKEFSIMKALGRAGLPIPKIIALCQDPSVLGIPFYLMEYCPGRVFLDPSLPGLDPEDRKAVYQAITRVLYLIHTVDPMAVGLQEDNGTDYVKRQVHLWTQQYRESETHTIPAVERLIEWLPQHLPQLQRTSLMHGDFRLDNLVFHPDRPEVVTVLNWRLSTLGDPLCDLASICMAHYLPPDLPILPGMSQCDLFQLGIPSAKEIFDQYSHAVGLGNVENWQFYMAFSFFKLAANRQVFQKRSLTDTDETSSSTDQLVEQVATLGWDFATKEGFRIFNALPREPPQGKTEGGGPSQSHSFSSWAR